MSRLAKKLYTEMEAAQVTKSELVRYAQQQLANKCSEFKKSELLVTIANSYTVHAQVQDIIAENAQHNAEMEVSFAGY